MPRLAHLADCHLGAWRDPRMRALADEAFISAMDRVLAESVDFVIIAGDLFNSALPGIDHVKLVVTQLSRLRDAGIRCYFIAGSHDCSPTGKTMLAVLEEAGLATDVCVLDDDGDVARLSLVRDGPTGVLLAGLLGKAGSLERTAYERLDRESLEAAGGLKVFVFHAAIEELRPREMDVGSTQSVSLLPRGFGYYAGGHVHIVADRELDGHARIVYPGPLFPASFSELEQLGTGGFCIVDLDENGCDVTRVPVGSRRCIRVDLTCEDEAPEDVASRLSRQLEGDVEDAIVLVRVRGTLSRGTAADISFREIFAECERRGAYHCLKNTVALKAPSAIEVDARDEPADQIEQSVIREVVASSGYPSDERHLRLIEALLKVLADAPGEETKRAHEERVVRDARKLLQDASSLLT